MGGRAANITSGPETPKQGGWVPELTGLSAAPGPCNLDQLCGHGSPSSGRALLLLAAVPASLLAAWCEDQLLMERHASSRCTEQAGSFSGDSGLEKPR